MRAQMAGNRHHHRYSFSRPAFFRIPHTHTHIHKRVKEKEREDAEMGFRELNMTKAGWLADSLSSSTPSHSTQNIVFSALAGACTSNEITGIAGANARMD